MGLSSSFIVLNCLLNERIRGLDYYPEESRIRILNRRVTTQIAVRKKVIFLNLAFNEGGKLLRELFLQFRNNKDF